METNLEKKIEIVKINPADFGVEESKAKQIAEQFKPMLDKMIELESEFNEVIKLDINDPMTTFKAKEVRLKYVKVRTGTAAIHKQQKDFYLQAGRFIDGWKNAQLFASQGIEERLETIEKHYENTEKKRIASIAALRIAELQQYDFDGSAMNLGVMDDGVYASFLIGTKLAYEANKAEEKRLAEEKIAKEKADEEERERISAENAKLKAEAEAKEKQLEEERAKANELLESQRKAAEAKAKKEKEISDAKLKLEREAKEAIEAELRAKKDAERKAEDAKQAEIKAQKAAEAKAEKAPDKAKLTAFIDSFTFISPKLNTNEAVKIATDITFKFEAFKNWANEQIKTL